MMPVNITPEFVRSLLDTINANQELKWHQNTKGIDKTVQYRENCLYGMANKTHNTILHRLR